MNRYAGREMSDETANKLRKVMMLADEQPLPEDVADTFWDMKAACDRLNIHPSDQLLVMVAMASGRLPVAPPSTFLELVKGGVVRYGTAVTVLWRKKPATAKFLRMTNNGCVLVDLAGEERSVDAKTVSLSVSTEGELLPA